MMKTATEAMIRESEFAQQIIQKYVDTFTECLAEMTVKYFEIRVNEKFLFHAREILGPDHSEILSLPINYDRLMVECCMNII